LSVDTVAVQPKPMTSSKGKAPSSPGTTIVSANAIAYASATMLSTMFAEMRLLIRPMVNAAVIAPTPSAAKSTP